MDELQAQIQLLTNRVNQLEARNFNQNFSNTIIQNKETVVQRGGVQSAEFVSGASGWRFDADGNLEANAGFFRGDITGASGTFSGNISGGSVDIGGADSTSFHVDTSGNMWLGASAFNINTNPFAVSSAGAMRATSGVLGPWTLSSSAISTGAFDTLNTLYFGTSGLSLSNVFKVTAAGAMTATAGVIGPWTISPTSLSTGAFDTFGTMYFGNSGISLSNTFKVTSGGAITATSGTLGGFTITNNKLYGSTIQTAAIVGGGNSGVILDSAGLRGYDAILGTTFNLPTNGDAPEFSSGIISQTIFEINTNAVLRTSSTVGDGSPASEGVLINDTGLYGVGPDQLLADANVRILSNGDAFFSGTFNLGGTQITIGTDDDIQTALNEVYAAGGGTVYLDVGTYTLTDNVDVPSGVRLEGVSRDGVIIDCDGSFGIRIIGSGVYSTGTVTINNGDTTVVGSGTTWTAGMVGLYILLDGLWYEITARTDNTHITITEYQGADLSGSNYVLAEPNFNATVSKITVTNSTGAGVTVQHTMEPNLFDLVIYGNGTGIDIDYTVFPRIVVTSNENGVNLNMNFVEGPYVDYSEFSFSTSGAGIVANEANNGTLFNFSANDNTGNGISATNCRKLAILSFDLSGNGACGIEFISGCNDNQLTDGALDGNTTDNIKLTATSDRNSICQISNLNAGGYGINIASITCDNNNINSPAFGTNGDANALGNINDLGMGTTILPNVPSFTAAEDLSAGDPVGVSNLVDNNVSRGVRTMTKTAHGITNPLLTVLNNRNYCPIGGDKFVYLQYTAATSDTLFAQVGSIDRVTNTVAVGTAATVATAFTPNGTALGNVAICKLDTDKFIVFYLADASTTNIQYRVGTVTGTSISFGAAATFVTAGSTLAASVSWGADQISTNKGIMFFNAPTETNGRMVAFTVSGDTATPSVTPVAMGTNTDATVSGTAIKKIGTDKYVVVCPVTANSLYAQVCTLSGTVITAGTEVQISTATSAGTGANTQIVSPATNVFVVRLQGSGTTVAGLVACTVSGTVPSPGTLVNTTAGGTNFGARGGVYAASSSVLYVTGGSSGAVSKVTLSGTTLTDAGIVSRVMSFDALITNPLQPQYTMAMDNGYFVMANISAADVTNGLFWIQGMSNNFIGIVQENVVRGGSASVLVSETDNNQSGLNAGAIYQILDGGLVFAGMDTVADNINEQFYVKAISSTKILV